MSKHTASAMDNDLTGHDLKAIREREGLSKSAISRVVGRSVSCITRYEEGRKNWTPGRALPEDVQEALRGIIRGHWERPMSASVYANLVGKRVLDDLDERRASEKAGEQVRLLDMVSAEGPTGVRYGVGRSGSVYGFAVKGATVVDGACVGGAWEAKKRSHRGGQVSLRDRGQDTAMSHARCVALAWKREAMPFEGAEAYVLDEDGPVTPGNVGWRTAQDRVQEMWGVGRENTRSSHVNLENAVVDAIYRRYAEETREHGLTYVIDCLLRDQLGMERMPTPYQRKSGKEPGTKAAKVLLLARREPELTTGAIAEQAGTTEAYARRVLDTNDVSLRELRRRKQRNEAIEKAMRERRNDNVVTSARTGRHTLRSLAEQYNISEQTVQRILSDAGVSLAEIKAQRLKAKRDE